MSMAFVGARVFLTNTSLRTAGVNSTEEIVQALPIFQHEERCVEP